MLGLLDRTEALSARALASLPARVQVLLSGGRRVTVDGQALDPGIQLVLRLHAFLGAKPVNELGAEEGRRRANRDAVVHAGQELSVGSVRALQIPGPACALRARHYVPPGGGLGAPLLLYLHGGGFVIGDLETHDPICRVLCAEAGIHVVALEYRLAPEHPYPAAVDDSLAAFEWLRAHAEGLGADPARTGIGGDSAGGNLSTVVCLRLRERGLVQPRAQILIYPATDRSREYPSLEAFARGFFLTREEIDWYFEQYAGRGGASGSHPEISPLLARDLSGLAPALLVTAAFDPLRDEGEAYAEALRRSGNRVEFVRVEGLVHGFVNMGGLSRAARAANLDIAVRTKRLLE